MSFVHKKRRDFADLVEIVAAERGLRRSIVEKDYWITHTLWALSVTGFEVWFKGGTSLSKGFGLIERFSEDLDLKIEHGTVSALPPVSNWKSEGTKATAARQAYVEAFARVFVVPDCRVELEAETLDKAWRSASFRVHYPSAYPGELPPEVSDHVLLEIGNARVTPYVPRDITSWVHEKVDIAGLGTAFDDNRAKGIRCVHPLVTLLEKLDAIHRRFPNANVPPQTFVRHYEDAARLVQRASTLPPLTGYADVRALAEEMLAQKQLAQIPVTDDLAFAAGSDARWTGIRSAHVAIQPMYWGPRVSIDDACAVIHEWIAIALG